MRTRSPTTGSASARQQLPDRDRRLFRCRPKTINRVERADPGVRVDHELAEEGPLAQAAGVSLGEDTPIEPAECRRPGQETDWSPADWPSTASPSRVTPSRMTTSSRTTSVHSTCLGEPSTSSNSSCPGMPSSTRCSRSLRDGTSCAKDPAVIDKSFICLDVKPGMPEATRRPPCRAPAQRGCRTDRPSQR